MLEQLSKIENADKHYLRVIEVQSNFAPAHVRHIRLLLSVGHGDKAKEALNSAMGLISAEEQSRFHIDSLERAVNMLINEEQADTISIEDLCKEALTAVVSEGF